jgi:hypothetical protein
MLSPRSRLTVGLGLLSTSLLVAGTVLSMYAPGASSVKNGSAAGQLDQNSSNKLSPPHRLDAAYGRMNMSFEANRGQSDASVDFMARGAGYTLFLKPTEAVLALSRKENARVTADPILQGISTERLRRDQTETAQRGEAVRATGSSVLRMQLVGANQAAKPVGEDELEGKVNYFIGNDPDKWQANIPTYARTRYSNVYPGIDVVYYGSQLQLEYDFKVAAGSDYRQISLKFEGADSVRVEEQTGDLLIDVNGKTVRQHKPLILKPLALPSAKLATP